MRKDIKIRRERIGLERRKELLSKIQENVTLLPNPIEHDDLDREMLGFLKSLSVIENKKPINVVDIMVSTQNWSKFLETFEFKDIDDNIGLPFIMISRNGVPEYGKTPSVQYRIPNAKTFNYRSVPVWNNNRKGVDIYSIPQPIPVDIPYSIKIFTNRQRTLNAFNKKILKIFSSRQAYINVKGHYMPVTLELSSDESNIIVDKRKYFVQIYNVLLSGYILDEDEFEVKPAISRVFLDLNVETNKTLKGNKPQNGEYVININFNNINEISEMYRFDADLIIENMENISNLNVEINNTPINIVNSKIQISKNDLLRLVIDKIDENINSTLKIKVNLL